MWTHVKVPPTVWCAECNWPLEPGREGQRRLCWVCEDMLAALMRDNASQRYWRERQAEWEAERDRRRRMRQLQE